MSTMQIAATLYQLQQLDLELERLVSEQQVIKGSLQDNTDLHKARLEHSKAQKQFEAAARAQKEAERSLEDLGYRLSLHEKRLYSGVVSNPKELNALQQEVQHVRAQQSRQEEVTLETMDVAERLQEVARRKAEAVKQAEEVWERESAVKLTRAHQLAEKQEELQAQRALLAQSMKANFLSRYEALQRTKQGRPVSKVEHNACQWCRVILTPSELQHARISSELQFCTNCGRILYCDR